MNAGKKWSTLHYNVKFSKTDAVCCPNFAVIRTLSLAYCEHTG